jgi:DNA invertase Pin-like site-specific DNA recombinase
MVAEPGPNFRWGAVLRKSKAVRKVLDNGQVVWLEESTDRQEMDLLYHIRDNHMGVIVQSYKDIASGWKLNARRPGFKSALMDLESGTIDGIAVLAVDRLTRRRDMVRPILNALEAQGARLFALWDELDTADDDPEKNTELRLHELVARAEREAVRTSRRYKQMHAHRARKGLAHRNGVRPFGHTVDWFNLVDEEVELIHEAATRILQGEYPNAVALDWMKRGIRTPRGATRWGPDTLKCILTSHRMVAERFYNGVSFPLDGVPAIFEDRELWERVRVKLETAEGSPKVQRLLSGILRCGATCGLPLVGNLDKRGLPTYVCRKRRDEQRACGGVEALCAPVDKVVSEQVVDFLNQKQRVEALLRQHALSSPEMDAIDAQYAELEESKIALEEAAFDPPLGVKRLPKARYYELRERLEQQEAQLQRQRRVNREAEPLKAAMKRTWTVESWAAQPLQWRRDILRLVVKQMTLEPRGQGKGRAGPAVFDPERVRIEFAS